MGRGIIKLEKGGESRYLEWSTIVDAPVTWGMTLDEFKEYYRDEYGAEGMRRLAERMARTELKGTSFYLDADVSHTIRHNRAGDCEACLAPDQIWEKYVDRAPSK